MGGGNVTNTSLNVESIVKSAVDVIQQNSASCNASSSITQVIQVNAGNDVVISNVELSGKSYINSKCLAEVENDASVVTQIVNAVETEVENITKQGTNLGINYNKTNQDVIAKAITDMRASFTMQNVITCMSSNEAVQSIIANAGNNATLTDISIAMDSTILQNCTLNGLNKVNSVTDITSTLAAAAANSTTQGSDLTLIFGIVIIAIIVLIVLFFGSTKLLGKSVGGVGNLVKNVGQGVGSVVGGVGQGVGTVVSSFVGGSSNQEMLMSASA